MGVYTSEIAAACGNSVYLLRAHHTFFHSSCTTLHFYQDCIGFPVPLHLHQHLLFSAFLIINHPDGSEVLPHCFTLRNQTGCQNVLCFHVKYFSFYVFAEMLTFSIKFSLNQIVGNLKLITSPEYNATCILSRLKCRS